MIDMIKEHLRKYPDMLITDVLKLIYQSEFGGGHFVQDESKSLQRLKEEFEAIEAFPQRAELWEPIGDDMCRVNLDILGMGLEAEALNKLFVLSANQKRGSVAGLEEKLGTFMEMCEQGMVPFAQSEVKSQVEGWKAAGYPAISHSETYRENYQPAYRVVEKRFCVFLEALLEIDKFRKASEKRRINIVIDGMCASGKTTLGELLQRIYGGNLFHMDDFFLQPQQRTAERLQEPGGNVDYERFKEEIIDHLEDKQGLSYGIYDCSIQRIEERVEVPYQLVNIIEGSYSAHPYFGEVADLQFFLELDTEEQIKRIQARDGEVMLERFKREWIPMENRYFEALGIKEKSICLRTDEINIKE